MPSLPSLEEIEQDILGKLTSDDSDGNRFASSWLERPLIVRDLVIAVAVVLAVIVLH